MTAQEFNRETAYCRYSVAIRAKNYKYANECRKYYKSFGGHINYLRYVAKEEQLKEKYGIIGYRDSKEWKDFQVKFSPYPPFNNR